MENKANADIRKMAKRNGIAQWQIAEALGISEYTLLRKLRTELSAEQKKLVIEAIETLKEGDE